MNLRVLHIEDNPFDSELVQAKLKHEGVHCDIFRVEVPGDIVNALNEHEFDIVFCDYSLPKYDGLSALKLVKGKKPEIPFIFISGTIGEVRAIEALKQGATDYILKDDLARLSTSVKRALTEAEERLRRKQAEQTLKLQTSYFRQLFENSPVGIALFDLEEKILDVNKAFESLFQYTPEEIKGKTIHEFIVPRDRQTEAHEFSAALRNEELVVKDTIRRKKDGKAFPVRIIAFPIRVEGRVVGFYTLNVDLSEIQKAEQQLEEQAALLNVTNDAVIVRDFEDRILFWNKGAEKLYGLNESQVKGKTISELMYRDNAGLEQFMEAKEIVKSKGEWHGELRHLGAKNQPVILDSRWTLVRDQEGKPTSILVVSTDITDRKALEQQFYRAQRMESLGTLAGGIAHDLNNALGPILLAVQSLKKKSVDDYGTKLLEMIEQSARRGADMVKQILTFARGSEGERSALEPRKLLGEIEHIVRETFPKSIEIKSAIPDKLWAIQGDATQLHQAFLNLCLNARDAIPGTGSIHIEAENRLLDSNEARFHVDAKPGLYVIVSISDTGTGMPQHVRERIFDPFFTTKEKGKGTGLGLSTVLGIVKAHGGFITVHSELNKGTRFRLFLPAIEPSSIDSARYDEKQLPLGNGELVLVVDDEGALCEMTRETLIAHGYKALTASDGTEAVIIFGDHKDEVKVVITDVMMPFMDGPSTIRALQKMNPELKFIVISGLMENEKISNLRGTGAHKLLQKPFTTEDLLGAVRDVLHED